VSTTQHAWPKVDISLGLDARNQDIHDNRGDLQRRLPEVTRDALKCLLVTIVAVDWEAPWKCHLVVATAEGYGRITTKYVLSKSLDTAWFSKTEPTAHMASKSVLRMRKKYRSNGRLRRRMNIKTQEIVGRIQNISKKSSLTRKASSVTTSTDLHRVTLLFNCRMSNYNHDIELL
jgi:hypothetical protein